VILLEEIERDQHRYLAFGAHSFDEPLDWCKAHGYRVLGFFHHDRYNERGERSRLHVVKCMAPHGDA
jgi:hypothetical protein